MIAALRGILESRGHDWALVKVNGISLKLYMPPSTLNALGKPGQEVYLHTHLYLRQDHLALYGFSSPQELGLFEMLIGVSGVGPKAALSLLSSLDPGQLTFALASGNAELLSQVPGVGRKMASRLVLELKGKLETVSESLPTPANAEVTSALLGLGYTAAEAARALASLPQDPNLTLEDKVRLALQYFAHQGGT